jgi:hypothetical protein
VRVCAPAAGHGVFARPAELFSSVAALVSCRHDPLWDLGRPVRRRTEECLHTRQAHLEQRPLVLAAVVLAEPDRNVRAGSHRAPFLRTSLELGDPAHGVWLEEGQDLVQAIELEGLAHEIGRAESQTLARMALVHDPGDRDDRNAERPDGPELEEVEPAHARELDVKEDRAEPLGLEVWPARLRPRGATSGW